MKYRVEVVMSFWQSVDVEAENVEQARHRAFEAFDITKATVGGGEVHAVSIVFEPTPEERAFLDSYGRNVAQATDTMVLFFLEHKKNETIQKDSYHWWAGVEDAWLMWQDAKKFLQGESK